VEVREGIAVSPGIAICPAFPMESEEFSVSARPVEPESVDEEQQRFLDAVAEAVTELSELRQSSGMAGEIGQLFDAHIVLLKDKKIHAEVLHAIRAGPYDAEYSVRQVFDRHARRLARLEDEYFAERAKDIKDIEQRILRRLAGGRKILIEDLTEPVVVVAHDLSPSETASLDRTKVRGIAIDTGGRTSHTAIVARSLGIPAVVGLNNLSRGVEESTLVVVDGNRGRVVVDPDPDTLSAYERFRLEYEEFRAGLEKSRHLPAETLDGHRIKLVGNIERPSDARTVVEAGGDGVGLFRTEFLYVNPRRPPTEEEHYEAYTTAVSHLGDRPIVIRTLDLGGDKVLADPSLAAERNPFMGLRSLRFCLARPEMFIPQLKAILRASAHGDVRIMFPMVAAVEEVSRAKDLLAVAKDQLREQRKPFNPNIPVGIMVETPSAAVTVDLLAREVDFFSVGTNDLIQYAMAVDRGNARVAGLYQPAHPAILRLLSRVIKVGTEQGVEVAVCGEICGEPIYTILLLGMGLREFSLSHAMLPQIKRVIRSVTVERAREIARTAIDIHQAEQTERYLRASLRQILPVF
jgi:phosphotransferase system enzyme I (PtsI)